MLSTPMAAPAQHKQASAQGRRDPAPFLRQAPVPIPDVLGADAGADALLRREWLLPDGLGGFAMGTAMGAGTRRYHSLYVAATRPPLGRVNVIPAVVETLVLSPGTARERRVELSSFRFGDDALHPDGRRLLHAFRCTDPLTEGVVEARWTWAGDGFRVERAVRPIWGEGGVRIAYTARTDEDARLEVRPLVALRDVHGLLSAGPGFESGSIGSSAAEVRRGEFSLTLAADHGAFAPSADWWFNFRYDRDAERAYDAREDLFCPGVFGFDVASGGERTGLLAARLGAEPGALLTSARAPDARAPRLVRDARVIAASAGADAPTAEHAALARAADDFVVPRGMVGAGAGATILAGYPWFADWGRDAMISLPGLLLATGRREDALAALRVFAGRLRGGLVLNCFDDRTAEPQYNAADSTFWFLRAACLWAESGPDRRLPDDVLRACLEIVDAVQSGTDFGIGVDPGDGLVFAGDMTTQLTWMDAKADGTPCTPRYGKAVEINALWADALHRLASLLPPAMSVRAEAMRSAARLAQASMREKFWRPALGRLADCLRPDVPGVGAAASAWTPVDDVRPNMLVAAALEHSGLTTEQRRAVTETARGSLLTPVGLRTLAPGSPGYRPRYEGPMRERDWAYHNGTVWPWLLGFYVEALLRAGEFSPGACAEARGVLTTAFRACFAGACPGSVAEVYDADEPRRPDGCPAQAWSVAELLRAATLA